MINIDKDYNFTPNEFQLKIKDLEERAQAVLRIRKRNPEFKFSNPVCNKALARVLLKRNPLYTCIIDPELLLNPTIALYMVPSDGRLVDREASFPEYYLGFKESTDANSEYEEQLRNHNPALYKTYMMLKNIVAAADRPTAMRLIDAVVRYFRFTDIYHSLNVPLPEEFDSILVYHKTINSSPKSYEIASSYILRTNEYLELITNGVNKDNIKAAKESEKIRQRTDIPKA